MPCARRMPSRASNVRLECPTVYTVTGMTSFRILQARVRTNNKGDKDDVLIPLPLSRQDRSPAPRKPVVRRDLVLRRLLPGRSLAPRRGVLRRRGGPVLRRGGALVLSRRRPGLRRRPPPRWGPRGGLVWR